ncbi:MAG TPA: MFS transporter [Acidimicrobiia bacterium]|nr:MFS transporter [Acidimicrobiia bacterium]
MNLSRSFAPLRHRQFALLWAGAFTSNIGTWMETVGVGVLVTTETGQAGWAGLVAAAGFVPTAVLAPLGGALADRIPRRRLLLTTTAVQTALAGLLTFLTATGTPGPGIVTLIVLGAGCSLALGFPAYQALLPDLVPREDLPGAIALSSAQWNLGRVIGPALAGVVIRVGGYAWAFGFNTISFAAVIAVLLVLRLPRPAEAKEASIIEAIRAGARFVRADPGLRVVVGYMALNSLLAAPFIALVPAFALKVFHNEQAGTAALVTAQGVGAVLMGLSLGALHAHYGGRRVLLGVLWGLPVALCLYAFAPNLVVGVVAIFVVGFLYLGALSSFTTIAQLRSPAHLRGRVLSFLMVLLGTLYPLGSVLQGAIADRVGLRATTAGAGVLMAGALLVVRLARPSVATALDSDATDAPPTVVEPVAVAPER